MAIPDNNDLLSLLMQNQEKNYITSEKQIGNSKVLQPPKEGQFCENCLSIIQWKDSLCVWVECVFKF